MAINLTINRFGVIIRTSQRTKGNKMAKASIKVMPGNTVLEFGIDKIKATEMAVAKE